MAAACPRAAHPEQVEKLVLVDAAGIAPNPEEARQVAANFGGKQHISELLIPKNIEELARLLRTLFCKPRYIPKFVLREILEEEFWHNRQAKLRMCDRMEGEGGFLAPADLQSILAPTLLIWGKHAMLEEPRRFNSQVLQFLSEKDL